MKRKIFFRGFRKQISMLVGERKEKKSCYNGKYFYFELLFQLKRKRQKI